MNYFSQTIFIQLWQKWIVLQNLKKIKKNKISNRYTLVQLHNTQIYGGEEQIACLE